MPAVEMSSDVRLLLRPKGDSNLLGRWRKSWGVGGGGGEDGKKEVQTQPLLCDDVMATRFVDMLSGNQGRL